MRFTPYLLLLFFLSPRLLSFGMFLDGTFYASIARNLAEGLGSFWHLQINPFESFYDHPPLAMWLQAKFFLILGDTRMTERLYDVLCGFLQLWLIKKIWKCGSDKKTKNSGWFAQLIFVCTPLTVWMFQSNMLENTLNVFALGASYLLIQTLSEKKKIFHHISLIFLAQALILAAFLSKGVFGLYPLAIPFLFYFVEFKFSKKILSVQSLLLIFFGLSFGALLLFEDARTFLKSYMHVQVFASLAGERERAHAHFGIFIRLIEELLAMLFVAFIFKYSLRKKSIGATVSTIPHKYFWLAIAISTSLPLAISPKNRAWFLSLSLPFYSLFLASLFNVCEKKMALLLENPVAKKKLHYLQLALLGCALITGLIFRNNASRYPIFHQDFSVEKWKTTKEWKKAYVCPQKLMTQYALKADFSRDYHLAFTEDNNASWLVVLEEEKEGCLAIMEKKSCIKEHPQNPKNLSVYKCLI